MLSGILTDFKDALMTGLSGTDRPSNLQAGGVWIDTSNQNAPDYTWAFMLFDGVVDIEIFRISILNSFGGAITSDSSFEIRKYSADAVGPILELIKNRISNNGQVLTGDIVSEVKFSGRTNSSTDPVTALLRFTATDNMVTAASGGTFSMYSTADGGPTLAEHLRYIDGLVETVAAHRVNSRILVSQNVATAATIAQLSAAKVVVEMTGATATSIQGINSAHASKSITIHNRSSASVTLKHLNSGAVAADRIKLPHSADHIIYPEESATLFYNTADTYWKLVSSIRKKLSETVEEIEGVYQTWTAPVGVTNIKVVSYAPRGTRRHQRLLLDPFGNLYAWGFNANGMSGVGDTVTRSSPVLVLGGITFRHYMHEDTGGSANQSLSCSTDGIAYGWGSNSGGDLGLGDQIDRSSPVAVLGGIKFAAAGFKSFGMGLTPNGSLYSWGTNQSGQLGLGDTTNRSSPILVLGGLKFAHVAASTDSNGFALGITTSGDLYAWGGNDFGQLGVGDQIARSSPVAVLGGIKFKQVVVGTNSSSILGLAVNGDAYAWGENSNGQLGVGSVAHQSSPVLVVGGIQFKRIGITGGTHSSYGLSTSGDLYAWGDNLSGQLGVGDVTPRSSPVAVLGGLKFKYFTAAAAIAGGVTSDGSAYAWGNNVKGSVGDGTSVSRSSPVAVIGGLKWEYASVDPISHGLSTDGTTYYWGSGNSNALPLGDTVSRSSPVAVVGPAGYGINVPLEEVYLSVIPGQSYTVVLSQGTSFFGDNQIGIGVGRIIISYDT
jgi:alpha-tubulin suppressor-like RCC1 family protein